MKGADTIAIIILAAIVIAVCAYLLHWLYRRSTKDVSFVRTGFGGEKVVMGGGALVLPILHDLTEVNMNTLRLEVTRAREKSLITKDRMRVELTVEFYVRVAPDVEAVATAARSLGNRTMKPDQLKDLVQGRFVDAMGGAAAKMTLEHIHENRQEFVKEVRKEVAESLKQDGLELESVSLTSLDQTDISLFDPSNTFDAEGLTILTEQIESRKKKRNDIEKDTQIAIRAKNLEAEKRSLEIQRDTEYARLDHEAEVSIQRAMRKSEIANENAGREREIEAIKLKEREVVERTRIDMEREIELLEIKRREALQIEEQVSQISISLKSKERSEAQAEAEGARAKMIEAQERVQTIRDTEIANRQKSIELIEAQKGAESEAIRIRIGAEAEKVAAKDKADADRIAVAALAERYKVEAEGKQKINEAENVRSDANRRSGLHKALVENLPAIIRESVKPMEKIEGIKIVHVDGMPGFSGGGGGAGGGGGGSSGSGDGSGPRDGSLADQVVSSALRYRSQAPFVDMLLGEIGMDADNIHRTHTLQDLSKVVYTEPNAQKPTPETKPKTSKRSSDK
ncbi:MAG: flotillin family protein [Alphaproteobacteria bacterium]|nr:flotillin family protein [Alphaproteobacteria bacterium]MBU0804219.1 flotillin family protein [Alphaproteobacteria bacterium]MBU0871050.1 flotillin family protein [Alphaproteobacteria bacterium]MBU1400805.1 flotillin family protein [Alphaproteobacteria bacterium]MBU1592778.1 flotillin family protein [Alphaproteobacteria bacterium]